MLFIILIILITKLYIVPVLSHQTIDSTSTHYGHHCKPKFEIQNLDFLIKYIHPLTGQQPTH